MCNSWHHQEQCTPQDPVLVYMDFLILIDFYFIVVLVESVM
jgi:hypothetical protein